MRPIPLAFRPHFKPVVWGGRRLREVFGADCPDERVGEAWLVSDREGAWSRVAGGAHDGRTLGEVVADDPEGWLGRAVVAAGGATFPLLVKLIDAAADLSVQVHPDEATARELGGSDEAKSECWSILEAGPGARIYLGVRKGVVDEDLRVALDDGTLGALCNVYDASPGDVFFVPAGAVHAIGAGIRLLEIQEASDTTYRLHDWGRVGADGRPRTLHIEEGLRAARVRPRRAGRMVPRRCPGLPYERDILVQSDAFTVERLRFALPVAGCTDGDRFHLAVVTAGRVELGCDRGRHGPFPPWSAILLPAALGDYTFRPLTGDATVVLAAPGRARIFTPPAARIRLQKVLAAAGIGSRRECERLIAEGRVTVDGAGVTEMGVRVDPRSQTIRVDGERLQRPESKVYYLLYKPRGVVCTNRDQAGRPRAVDLVAGERRRLYTIGRLDIDSEGAILLTNDGELALAVAHPRFAVAKVYLAHVRGRLEPADIQRIEKGVWLADGKVGGITVQVRRVLPASTWLRVILREGKNREIRRVFARLGYPVKQLKRVRIGPVSLKGLGPGQVRRLSAKEVEALRTPGSHDVGLLAAGVDDGFLPPRPRLRRPARPVRAQGARRGPERGGPRGGGRRGGLPDRGGPRGGSRRGGPPERGGRQTTSDHRGAQRDAQRGPERGGKRAPSDRRGGGRGGSARHSPRPGRGPKRRR